MKTLTFGSLFAGIGGFDLGFERAGFNCRWQVEIDSYATKILEKHWPKVHRERDIRECNASNLGRVDCIIGGFPCQDISYAGRGAGLAGERSGLFFEAVRLVRELQPRAVVLENVAALLTRGLDRVLGTLAEIGYDAEWHCIPAAAVGAPHIRDRVFVIGVRADAFSKGARNQSRADCGQAWECTRACEPEALRQAHGTVGAGRVESVREDVANADCQRCSEARCSQSRCRACGCGSSMADPRCELRETWSIGESSGEGAPQRKVELGRSSWWAVEPDVGRVAHGVPRRVDRLRCLGNAIVPQVAEVVARMTLEVL